MRVPVAFYRSEKHGVLIGEPIPLDRRFYATSKEYEEIILKVREAYNAFIKEAKNGGLRESLDKLLRSISHFALFDGSFIECLVSELNLSKKEIEEAILSTNYFSERLEFLKRNFRKVEKENVVEYAEGFGEIVSILGFNEALRLLRKNGIKMGKSTLQYLYHVSMMPTWLKRRIGVDIPLTVAFELPKYVDEEVVEKIAGLNYQDAKKVLKELKRSSQVE